MWEYRVIDAWRPRGKNAANGSILSGGTVPVFSFIFSSFLTSFHHSHLLSFCLSSLSPYFLDGHLTIQLSVCSSIHYSIHQSTHLCVYLYISLSVHPLIHHSHVCYFFIPFFCCVFPENIHTSPTKGILSKNPNPLKIPIQLRQFL